RPSTSPRAHPQPAVRARSTPLLPPFAVDALGRPGDGGETLLADRLPTGRALPETAVLDARQRRFDRTQHVLGVLLERVVDLTIERDRSRLGEVVVDRRFLGLIFHRPRVLLMEIVDRI